MALFVYGLYHFTFKVWLASYTNHNQEIEIPDLSQMTIQEAIERLDQLGLIYEVDSVRHDSTRPVYAVLEFHPHAGFKVKEGRKVFIKSNPKSWQPVLMPDIVGKSKRLALTQLKISGLVVGDTIYEPDLARDAVLRVMYKGKQIEKGTELPRFSKIDLVLGKGLEYGVKTPNLLGMSLEDAKALIYANRFDVGRITVHGSFLDSANLKVYYQYPIRGDNYDQGLPVDLWLSESPFEELTVVIKDLDRQYRNSYRDDSVTISLYEERLENDPPIESSNEPKIPEQKPKKQPRGIQFLDK